MKLRHNDLLQLRKSGLTAITAKISELKKEFLSAHKDSLTKSSQNPKSMRLLRRSLAQLNTLASEIRGTV